MNKIYTLTSFLLCPLALGGCDAFRNTFGLDHSAPNEWNAAEPSAGLILPPDLAHRPKLPPPTPGAPNPHVVSHEVRAQKTVLGGAPAAEPAEVSDQGEKDILEKASENQEVTPDIRKVVDEEAQAEDIPGKVVQKIKSWKKEATENLTTIKPKEKPGTNKDETAKQEG